LNQGDFPNVEQTERRRVSAEIARDAARARKPN
jgi:hypothetical protein